MDIIAGDIGGTKSWLVWVSYQAEGRCDIQFEKVYASADFASATDLLEQFYQDAGQQHSAQHLCLALPGPVTAQRPVRLTNLDWTLVATELQQHFQAQQVSFLNDFQAAAAGVATLDAADYQCLNTATALEGATRVITGPGTGLGLAWMQPDAQGNYQAFATEGGHSDFAPANAQQERLLAFIRQYFSHVSWERVLSGPGVNFVYQFCLQDMTGEIPAHLAGLNGAEVNKLAAEGDAVARAAMLLFTDIFANWVGNIALFYQPRAGLYLAGGISARIQPWLQTSYFLEASTDKGRMSGLVSQIPVYLITNTRLGLQGALAVAQQHINGRGRL